MTPPTGLSWQVSSRSTKSTCRQLAALRVVIDWHAGDQNLGPNQTRHYERLWMSPLPNEHHSTIALGGNDDNDNTEGAVPGTSAAVNEPRRR